MESRAIHRRRALPPLVALGVVGAITLGGVIPAAIAGDATASGAMQSVPLAATLSALPADGSTSGQFSGLVDLPVMLGDNGVYSLPGTDTPAGDASGNASNGRTFDAGLVAGVITDPEDGEVDDEPGQGITIAGGSDHVGRTPSGLTGTSTVSGVAFDLVGLNHHVADLFGISEVAYADEVRTDASASVTGATSQHTAVSGLRVLGEQIALTDGALPAPVTRSTTVHTSDIPALLRSLGIEDEDISQYEDLLSSGTFDGTLTVTAATPESGGLRVTAAITSRVRASLILGLGALDLSASKEVFVADVARFVTQAPEAMRPSASSVSATEPAPGDTVTVNGAGYVVGGTQVLVGGSVAEVTDVAADGRTLSFVVPAGLPTGSYRLDVITAGGQASPGSLDVRGADYVPLTVTGISPQAVVDGGQVQITGTGFAAGATSVAFTDEAGRRVVVPASRVAVEPSGLTLTVSVPEGLATGSVQAVVGVGSHLADAVTFTVQPLTLPDVPATGSAAVTGVTTTTTTVPLTVDNSSPMTWSAPSLINPAGSAGTSSALSVGAPSVDPTGRGTASGSAAGLVGTTVRSPFALTAQASATGYTYSLPSPWSTFFAANQPVIAADAITATATAASSGASSTDVAISNLRVLGQTVALSNGRIAGPQTFSVTYDYNTLKSARSMDGIFFSSANEAYNRIKSQSYATLRVTVAPGTESAGGGSADATAFTVTATIQYRYYGENGGIVSTRARHGSGTNRDGTEVQFMSASVGHVTASAPQAVTPAVVSVAPNSVSPGDTVTIDGRGFSADSSVQVDGVTIAPTVVSDTRLTAVVPGSLGAGLHALSVVTGAGTSNSRTLSVQQAPQVVAQPEPAVQVDEGDTVTLSAQATGEPEPSVQWQRHTAEGWVDVPGATAASLTLVAARSDEGARFRAVFTSAAGSAITQESVLSVAYAPVITAQPTVGELTAGDVVELRVGSAGSPEPSIQWQIDRGTGWTDLDGETAATWTSTVTAREDGARVRAVLTNRVGTVESDAVVLTVRYAPEITRQPADVTVEKGGAATFSVRAVGSPQPAIRWQLTTAASADDEGAWADIDPATNPTALTGDLELPATAELSGAHVRALVSNGIGGEVASAAAKLTVTAPVGEPADGVSALGSPLAIAVDPLTAGGQATGGALVGLINGELAGGVEITHPAAFSLPESGTPVGIGSVDASYPAGVPTGSGTSDLGRGTTYGPVTVSNARDAEGIHSSSAVASFRMDHLALDEDGTIGVVAGVDEIVRATDVRGEAVSLADAGAAPTAHGSIGSLYLLGREITADDGLVDGRLTRPVTVRHENTITDLPAVLAALGVDELDNYLNPEELSGTGHVVIEVTASQPTTVTTDGSSVTGLRVTVSASVELSVVTSGSSTALVERIDLASAGMVHLVTVDVAGAATARNGAELPEPGQGTPEEPEEPEEPTEPTPAFLPSASPDRVILSIAAGGGLTATWRTDATITDARAQLRPVGGEATDVPAQTRDVASYVSAAGGPFTARSHVATFGGLVPGARYEYRVGSESGGWSPWYTVTAPASSAQPFTMLYVGDAQNDLYAKWTPAIQQAYATVPEAAITLHAGDQINNSDQDDEWGAWFAATPERLAETPQIVVAGNHEYGDGTLDPAFREHFSNPDNGPQVTADPATQTCEYVYQKKFVPSMQDIVSYADYQGVRYVTLAGTTQVGDIMPPADEVAAANCPADFNFINYWYDFQAEYLDTVLKANPGEWSVVSIHQPLFSTAVGRAEAHLRDAFLHVIDENHVDLVLQGHDHTYGRGYLASHEVAGMPGVQDGTVFATSVLGPKHYELDRSEQNDWTLNGAVRVKAFEAVRTFQRIRFDGNLLTYDAISYPGGEVVDSVVTCRSADGSERYSAERADLLPANCSTAQPEQPTVGLDGIARTGSTLSAYLGDWLDGLSNPQVGYQWLRAGAPIDGATAASYQLTSADEGQEIALRVTVAADGYGPVVVTSAALVPEPAQPVALSLAVDRVDGAPFSDVTLTATLTGQAEGVDGTVTFYDGSVALGSVAVTNGVVPVFTTNGLGAGGHSLTAVLTGADGGVLGTSAAVAATYGDAPVEDAQTVVVTMPNGAITITSPYGADNPLNLGAAVLDPASSTYSASAAMDGIVITDTRTGELGFTASVVSGPFVAADGGSFDGVHAGLTGLSAAQVADNALRAGDVALTDHQAFVDGLGTPKVFAAYPAGKALGTTRISGVFGVGHVPSSVRPGLYTATVTFTAV